MATFTKVIVVSLSPSIKSANSSTWGSLLVSALEEELDSATTSPLSMSMTVEEVVSVTMVTVQVSTWVTRV